MYKFMKKITAVALVNIIAFANLCTIGIYMPEVLAIESNLENQTVTTDNSNVEFDAYFNVDEQKVHTTTNKISGENNINFGINVKNTGYLKNAKIIISQGNFNLQENKSETLVQKTTESELTLNQINSGMQRVITLPISYGEDTIVNLSRQSKESKVTFTAIYVDGNGKENNITKDIIVNVNWTEDVNSEDSKLEQELIKFVPYAIDNEEGVLIQTLVRTGIENCKLPIKQTTLNIVAPTINNTKPTNVLVYATSTKATNGDENGYSFVGNNLYNEEENTITITVQNIADENGNIIWKRDAEDEYLITYLYGKDVKDYLESNSEKIELSADLTIDTYSYESIKLTRKKTKEEILNEQIGTITSINTQSVQTNLSKGYMYANLVSCQKQGTEYETKITSDVPSKELVKNIVINISEDKIYNNTNEELVYSQNTSFINELTINKDMALKMLGENGTIEVYNGENKITSLNIKEAQDVIKIDLSSNALTSTTIKTSNLVSEGKFEVIVKKSINKDLSLTKEQISNISNIGFTAQFKNSQNVYDSSKECINYFIEPETLAELIINKENLSTIIKNENVELKIQLRTDSINNRLFNNPTITIDLPEDVKGITIKDIDLLFDEELQIDTYDVIENANGTKSIVIKVTGEQTKYNINSVTGGANIIIITDIELDRLAPNREENIVMKYTNENNIDESEEKTTSAKISYIAPTGLITTNSISNYKDGENKITSITGEEKTALIDSMAEAKTATFEMNVINNYTNTIDSIVILGRIPGVGTKDLLTTKDLGATFNTELKGAITTSELEGIKVYYSTNVEATKDLSIDSNGWTSEPESFENIKSYMIIYNGTLNQTEDIKFSFNVQIPSNLQYNQTAYENYIVYFNNNQESGVIQDKQMAAQIIITTGRGPVLQAVLSSNYSQDQIVTLGNYIIYTLKITNIGTLVAENVKIEMALPEYLRKVNIVDGEYIIDYIAKKYEENIEKIQVDETIEIQLTMQTVDSFKLGEENDIKTVALKAIIIADNMDYSIETNEVINNIKKPFYKIRNYTEENYGELLENQEIQFNVSVTTTNGADTSENTKISIPLPDGMKFIEAKVKSYSNKNAEPIETDTKINYDKNKNILTMNVGTVGAISTEEMPEFIEGMDLNEYNELLLEYFEQMEKITKVVALKVKIATLESGVYSKELSTYALVSGDDITEETSNITKYKVTKAAIEVNQTSSIPSGTNIESGDKLSYVITIKNIGERGTNITFTDIVPSELILQNAKIIKQDKTETSILVKQNNIKQDMFVKKGETCTIKIETVASIQEYDKVIKNAPTILIDDKTININEIQHILEKFTIPPYEDEDNPGDNPGDSPEEPVNKNKLSGLVWKDENKNGMYDNAEPVMSNIEVILLNATTNIIYSKTTTQENGVYTFSNLPEGEYIVIFLYDSGKYSATTYKQEGIEDEVNSDAIDAKINLDGKPVNVAITDKITLLNTNLYNIDLGLIDNAKFDLSLNKTVSKITIQDAKGTKTYNYNNENLIKVEFIEKNLGATTMIIEYKIAVTNQGGIDGYVKKIVDYLPTGLTFSTELNEDWYMGENGAVYNNSLANTKILSGETKEISLVLVKTVNTEDIGTTINNTAEIYEVYNDEGIEDYNSIPANKASNEDDIGCADVILSIKTGKVIMFISLTLTIIATIGIGVYFIKKKVLR